MTPKLRRRILRFTLIPLATLIILVGISIGILYSQHQRLVHYALTELNKQVRGEITVEGSSISLFQNFPYISIGLDSVRIFPNKDRNAPPICEAGRLFVGFNLPDLLRQKYRVKAIVLKNGWADLLQDTAGNLNIEEAIRVNTDSSGSASTSSANLDLDVKKLVIKDMKIGFLNQKSRQHITAQVSRIQASFQYDSTHLLTDLHGALVFDFTRPGDTVLFRHKRLETDIQLAYDLKGETLHLPKGSFKLEEALFNISGVADLKNGNKVDFRITGEKPDIRQLLSFAPAQVAKDLKHFKYDGRLDFDAKIKGDLAGGRLPLIEVSFACSNIWMHNTIANKKLDSVSLKGFYTNGAEHSLRTSELRLLDMYARPDKGIFKGNFIMRDFTDPKVLMQINSDLELGFVGAFLGIKDLQRITGQIQLKMDFKDLVDLDLPEQSMAKLTEGIQSELNVKNLTFRIPSYPYMIEHLNLHARMKNGFLQMDTMYCKIGNSDFHIDGSLTDLPALFHAKAKPVVLNLHARSEKIVFKELFSFDTVRSHKEAEEEQIDGFNLGLTLETSVDEILHPAPLPKGKVSITGLYATFKKYPHEFHDFGGDLTINDTAVLVRNVSGIIDSSDIQFKGKITNYALWFDKVMRGRTQIAFDLRSKRLAMDDLLGPGSKKYISPSYQQEVASNLWLRSKTELRYDSVFKFANIRIANISGQLRQHPFKLDSISGNIKFGTDNFIKLDTLKGIIGNSDFNISMRLYAGKDTVRRKKENYLQFYSHYLDLAQLMNYRLTAEDAMNEEAATLSELQGGMQVIPVADVSGPSNVHDSGFNIFRIPFIDFRASVNIDKLKYNRLGLKNCSTGIRMYANQQLYLDTLRLSTAGGTIAANGHFDGSDPSKIWLRSKINIEDVNLEKLMLKMDYLGQDYVINKNIRGSLSGQIESYVQVHPDLTPQMESTEAKLDLEILNGELVNFTPMLAMSAYFKDKNLNIVRFDTLRNTLTFKNGTLSIPDMNINSSLGFMEMSGTQSMDMQMEYYLRIPLKLVTSAGFSKLFGKKQEEVDPNKVDAIEYRDIDKRVRFINLHLSGTPADYKIKLGKAKKQETTQANNMAAPSN
jgi:hypothetical protein